VPLLDEVVLALRDRGELVVEIKEPAHAVPAARRLRELEATAFCSLISFDHRPLVAVRDEVPDLRTGCLLVARPVDPVGLVRAARADALSIHVGYVDADLVATCHEAGIAVCAWNCNDPAAIAHFAALGIDWLGTDVPTTVVPAARSR
jgi:glycerophosphoryl diester phosphodiesterase